MHACRMCCGIGPESGEADKVLPNNARSIFCFLSSSYSGQTRAQQLCRSVAYLIHTATMLTWNKTAQVTEAAAATATMAKAEVHPAVVWRLLLAAVCCLHIKEI